MVGFGGEANASGLGAFDIAYSIFGSPDVSGGGIEGMLGKDGCDGGEVRTGGVGEP